jgi:hypothetical protein
MVGHVNREKHSIVKEIEQTAQPAGHQMGAPLGEIRGTAVIRDEHGNVKGEFTFGGSTHLTAEEVKEQLGLNPGGQDGGDSNNDGAQRSS